MERALDRPSVFEDFGPTPTWLGLGVAAAWLLCVALAHSAGHWIIGPVPSAIETARFVWTVLVNASVLGLVVGGHAQLRRSVRHDLEDLRTLLPSGAPDFERRVLDVRDVSGSTRALATGLGLAGGLAVATLDPNLRGLHDDLSLGDPRYLVFVLQNLLFGACAARLLATEIHLTRAYTRLGEELEVDLFDTSPLLVFARKGLRSVVVWVLIFAAVSMFWVLDSAGQANAIFPIALLFLVAAALVGPTRGAHISIATAKSAELARVTDAIRVERDRALGMRGAPGPSGADSTVPSDGSTIGPPEGARLGDLVQYAEFVKSIREWPFDLSIVARSILLILLGAGSWVGGAIVERLLELVLD